MGSETEADSLFGDGIQFEEIWRTGCKLRPGWEFYNDTQEAILPQSVYFAEELDLWITKREFLDLYRGHGECHGAAIGVLACEYFE